MLPQSLIENNFYFIFVSGCPWQDYLLQALHGQGVHTCHPIGRPFNRHSLRMHACKQSKPCFAPCRANSSLRAMARKAQFDINNVLRK